MKVQDPQGDEYEPPERIPVTMEEELPVTMSTEVTTAAHDAATK